MELLDQGECIFKIWIDVLKLSSLQMPFSGGFLRAPRIMKPPGPGWGRDTSGSLTVLSSIYANCCNSPCSFLNWTRGRQRMLVQEVRIDFGPQHRTLECFVEVSGGTSVVCRLSSLHMDVLI